jgi:hypothetical protein
MNATRPEADFEYSRGQELSEDDFDRGAGLRGRSEDRPGRAFAIALLVGGLGGAILLLVAEFTPLLTIHSSLLATPIKTVNTGSHHGYALIPVALLAAVFTVIAWRTRSRPALFGLGAMGIVALLIALLGDLPDAQARGLVNTAGHLAIATDKPSTGFYLETLGAVVLLLTAAGGLLLAPTRARRRPRARRAGPTTSGSAPSEGPTISG